MGDVKAEGPRSVAIGGNANNAVIVTGDNSVVFRGDYETIGQAYINHASVFSRLDLDRFIHRDELVARIDEFLDRERHGYLVIEGESGLGKSALLGWLVRERGYIHHFVELTPGLTGVAPALRSLAAQLVAAYELNPFGVIPAAAAQPHYLVGLLAQASERIQGRRIVIVIDGLNQSAAPEGQNALGLPTTLPNGVFIIVSQQPVPVTLNAPEVPRRVIRLSAGDNVDHLRRYLEAAYDRLPAGNGVPRDHFINQILNKCDGRWQHLVLIVREIESGLRGPTDLETIPSGLTQQYCALYRRCRDLAPSEEWTQVLRPLLALIAAAEEPVSASMLAAWLSRPVTDSVILHFTTSRPALLVTDPRGSVAHYRPEHGTLRDFLHGRAGRAALTNSEIEILDEARRATDAAHRRLGSFYLQRFDTIGPGEAADSRLPRDSAVDRYGLSHVLSHLEQAGMRDDTFALLWRSRTSSTREQVRVVKWLPFLRSQTKTSRHHLWTELRAKWGTWVDVVHDVNHVWAGEGQAPPSSVSRSLSRQLKLSLLHSSLMSRISAMPSTLVCELVRLGLWSTEQSLSFAGAFLKGAERFKGFRLLADLGHALASRGDVEAALAAVKLIDVGYQQTLAFGRIAARFPEAFEGVLLERFRLFLTAAPHLMTGLREETDEDLTPYGLADLRGSAAEALAPALSHALAAQACGIVRLLPLLPRVFASTPLIARLDAGSRDSFVDEVVGVAQQIADDGQRLLALARVGPQLPADILRTTMRQVENALEGDIAKTERSTLLTVAQPMLVQNLPAQRVIELLKIAYMLTDQLPSLLRREAAPDPAFVTAAVESVLGNRNYWATAEAAAPHVRNGEWDTLMGFARDKQEAWLGLELLATVPHTQWAQPLKWIIPRLREDALNQFPEYFDKALPRLVQLGESNAAFSLAHEVRPSRVRARILSVLIPCSPEAEQHGLLDEALMLFGTVDDESWRLALRASCMIETGQAREALALLIQRRAVSWNVAEFAEHALRAGDPETAVDAMLELRDLHERLELLSRIGTGTPESALQRTAASWQAKEWRGRSEADAALCIVAARAPEAGMAGPLKTHLDGLMAITSAHSRAQGLALVIPYLAGPHLSSAIDCGLATLEQGPYASVSALTWVLVERLDDLRLRQLLQTLWTSDSSNRNLTDIFRTAMEIARRSAFMPPAGVQDSLITALRSCRTQQQIVTTVAEIVKGGLLGEVFAGHNSWVDDLHWAPSIADLAASVAQHGHPDTAVSLIEAIDVRYQVASRLRLVGVLPAQEFSAFWVETLMMMCRSRDTWIRSSPLSGIVPVLLQMPAAVLAPALGEALRSLALRSRDAYVLDLLALVPLIAAVGGREVFPPLVEACKDVGEWFP